LWFLKFVERKKWTKSVIEIFTYAFIFLNSKEFTEKMKRVESKMLSSRLFMLFKGKNILIF
jgi:hypothetical protein